jgi:DNA polymerase-3 subunit alpha
MGIEVLPPDVNESQVAFAPARNGQVIRFGMAAIKGVGEIAVQSILDARKLGGDFPSLGDMCERVDIRTVNRKALEALVKSGACDTFKETRATLFAQIDRSLTRAAGVIHDRQRGQSSMFEILEENSPKVPETVAKLPEWPQHELLAAEKELLGFYVTGHPLTPYVPLLKKYALTNTAGLAELPNRSLTRIGGLVAAIQQGISKKTNKPYALVTLEDLEGTVQILCINENHDKYREMLQLNRAILVVAEVNTGDDKPKLFPQEIITLEDAPRKYTQQVHFRLNTGRLGLENLDSVQELAVSHAGRCPLFLCFTQPTGEKIFIEAHERFSVAPSLQLQQAADETFGDGTYYAKVDISLPERTPRRWEQRGDSNGDG